MEFLKKKGCPLVVLGTCSFDGRTAQSKNRHAKVFTKCKQHRTQWLKGQTSMQNSTEQKPPYKSLKLHGTSARHITTQELTPEKKRKVS